MGSVGRLRGALEELRETVENINRLPDITMQDGGVYKPIDPDKIYTLGMDGMAYGYKVKDLGAGFFARYIFVRCQGQPIAEMADDELQPILEAVFSAMLDPQHGPGQIYTRGNTPYGDSWRGIYVPKLDNNTICVTQLFLVAYLVNRNPNLVSIAGGFECQN